MNREAAEVAVLGDCGVGKTSLLKRLAESRITARYEPTVGSDLLSLTPVIDGKTYRVFVHDFSGAPEFKLLRSELAQNVSGVVIVVDLRSDHAKSSVSSWFSELEAFKRPAKNPLVLICANNFTERQEKRAEVVALARSKCWDYCECSPTSSNVSQLFHTFFKKVVNSSQISPKSELKDFSTVPRTFGSAEAREALRRIVLGATPYEKLGLRPGASKDDINKAYKKLAMLLHPDKTDLVGAEEAFKALNAARNSLLPGSGTTTSG
ncbi:unnamed protein product [Notodromas monacha]|uniref:J domain-containing protein n=1 Tax=Notodromas monacha TaxID=399045 RepID=A0A7R9G9X5_9CRUS|nr:unnamed protein product [Notodromas monacha]CAG0913091.1 unnamed protein product [Notodromas monacha]